MAGDVELVGDGVAGVGQTAAQRALDDALDDFFDDVGVRRARGCRDVDCGICTSPRPAMPRRHRDATSSRAASTASSSSSSSVLSRSSSDLDVQRLAELGAVAIERVGLQAQLPAEAVAVLDVLDGRFVGQVDRLGDRAADERLGGGHHADVAFDGDEALAGLAALVGAVEDGEVLGA